MLFRQLRNAGFLVHDGILNYVAHPISEEQVLMSFQGAARAALRGKSFVRGTLVAAMVLSIALFVSCQGNKKVPVFGQSQNAYVTLPNSGSVLLVRINQITGAITSESQTPQVAGTSPNGLALLANKFLYAANSQANTVSIFNVASDGTLTQNGTPVPDGGSGPSDAVIDPSGKYLLVSNSLSSNVSVFSIDTSSGALTAVAGSPFYANEGPGDILVPAVGNLVYVSNSAIGTVTAFNFNTSTGALTPVAHSPFYSGPGASGLAVDATGSFLYVANTSAVNPQSSTVGNISAYSINATAGATYGDLSPVDGSPFTAIAGSGPTALVVDPNNRFLFATTPGANYSIWCFTISSNGQLTEVLNSPFSVAAGALFAIIDSKGNFFYIGSPSGIQAYTYDQNTGQPSVIESSPFSTNGTPPGKMVIAP
jgi:6-phosphogluconolactonase (cycloisomerase 2 family)